VPCLACLRWWDGLGEKRASGPGPTRRGSAGEGAATDRARAGLRRAYGAPRAAIARVWCGLGLAPTCGRQEDRRKLFLTTKITETI
jgi:hypothetical protein